MYQRIRRSKRDYLGPIRFLSFGFWSRLKTNELLATHEWPQDFRNFNPVFPLIILKDTANGPLSCSQGRIQQMDIQFRLFIILQSRQNST